MRPSHGVSLYRKDRIRQDYLWESKKVEAAWPSLGYTTDKRMMILSSSKPAIALMRQLQLVE